MLRQGDQYKIILKIEVNGEPMIMDQVELIEFSIGTLSKNWPLEVTYNEEEKEFYFPITQQETFKMSKFENYQVRIKYSDGSIFGSNINKINIGDSISRNII